jgi:hypothetical protein
MADSESLCHTLINPSYKVFPAHSLRFQAFEARELYLLQD